MIMWEDTDFEMCESNKADDDDDDPSLLASEAKINHSSLSL